MKLNELLESVVNFPSPEDRANRLKTKKIGSTRGSSPSNIGPSSSGGSSSNSLDLAYEMRDHMVAFTKERLSPRSLRQFAGLDTHAVINKIVKGLEGDRYIRNLMVRANHDKNLSFDIDDEFNAIIDEQICDMVKLALGDDSPNE